MAESEVGLRLSLKERRETAAGLAEVERGVTKVGSAADTAGMKAETSSRRFDKLRSTLGYLGRGVTYGVTLLTALGTAAATVGLRTAAGMEQANIAFSTMLGSARKARAFLGDLAAFAAKTPFEFPELQSAASSLISVGIRADKVIPIMTTLGDVTSGMGTGAEGIKRATVALQQMNAAQRITGEDLNQLRDAGIPVYDLLAAALGKTKGEVVALAQEGKLGKDALDAMMRSLETGDGLERFNGLMEKQSQSLTGLWSTMTDATAMGLKRIFTPVKPMAKDAMRWLTGLAEDAVPALRSGMKSAVGVVRDLVKAFKDGGFSAVLDRLQSGGGQGASKIAAAVGAIGAAVADIDWAQFGEALGQGTADTISVFAVAIGFAADHVDLLAKAMPYLVVGLIAMKGAQAAANAMAIAAVPLKVAEIAATWGHSTALRAHAAAMTTSTVATAANTTAEQVGLVTRTRAVVGIIAHRVATIASAAATKAWSVAQWLLNVALTANPIGLVVAGIALLVGGLILAYQKSETFRGIVDGLWQVLKPFGEFIGTVFVGYLKLLANMWLTVGRYGIKAFSWLLKAAFATFDGILAAAEKALGWLPEFGDKIRGARSAFDAFGDATINKLDSLGNKLQDVQDRINGVAKDRSATITITTVRRTAAESGGGTGYGPLPMAAGGIVRRRAGGLDAVIGEGRWDEAVVPMDGKRYLIDGTGVTSLPTVPELSAADIAVDDIPEPVGARTRQPLHVHVEIDGREVAEAVLDDIDDRGARR